ncbi:DUF2156 domain-containing protein [bacterium]|nr:DUF2156 domain-containing protein [bacterium]
MELRSSNDPCHVNILVTNRRLAEAIVKKWGHNVTCWQVFNPGISHWISADSETLIGYRAVGSGAVVVGEPIGPPDVQVNEALCFESLFNRVTWFGASTTFSQKFRPLHPRTHLPIGFQTMIRGDQWDGVLSTSASLRYQLRRATAKGVQIRRFVGSDLTQISRVLSQWKTCKFPINLYFMTDPDIALHPDSRVVWVAHINEALVGYLISSPVPHRPGWLLEQWVRAPDAPNGTIELLVHTAIRELTTGTTHTVTMGLCPLMVSPQLSPIRLERCLYRLGRMATRAFYDAESLTQFKLKFRFPDHERLWAITTSGWKLIPCHIDVLLAFMTRPSTIRD